LTGLAPRKVVKTASASAASAAPGLAGLLASSQDAPKRGALAAQVAVGRVPEADPSIEAVVVPREAAGAAAASSPPGGLPVLAVEPPVTANVEMAKAPLLEVGDREPAPLAEEVSDALAAGGVGALEEGGAEPQPVLGSGDLILAR
jgi:hypothetical protein